MPDQQQQQGQDNSLDILWMVGFVMALCLLIWYLGKTQITSFVFHILYYEIIAINFVIDLLAKLMQLIGLPSPRPVLQGGLTFIRQNISGVGIEFSIITKLSASVGEYTKYFLGVVVCICAGMLNFRTPQGKFRNVFDTVSFRNSEQENWPQIKPVLGFDLVKQKLDEGPWAMTLSPMKFCKKNDLLDVEERNGKYIATLRRGAAYRVLSLQLGPKWCGAESLPVYLKALFAIFSARVNGDKKTSENLLDQISASAERGWRDLNFVGVEEVMHKNMNSKGVQKIVSLHGYVTTVLASMLIGARSLGVLASSEFIWLKVVDRRMWYMLNSVGRQTAVSEISGAFAHWLAEKKLGLPLTVPMVDEAVRGLELALNDIIYKPDEDQK